ncbi:MAG TPA: hypothetical protein VHU83_04405 [Bryobacteraceae bacterium]|nr:hypothetical protein [Bryobacteraceae bacterium]
MAIGNRLARLARIRNAPGICVLEALSQEEFCTTRRLTGNDDTGHREQTSLEKAVGSFLSIANPTLMASVDSVLVLRMVVLGEYGEISIAALRDLIDELKLIARRRVGGRHTIECMFYLATPAEPPPEPLTEGVVEGVSILPTGFETEYVEASRSALGASDYCWWFTTMNSLGLSLSDDSCTAVATLVYAVVSTTPESYAAHFDCTAARPLHLCAGYAEITVSRADIERCLIARHMARVVRRRYLRACEPDVERITEVVRRLTEAFENLLEEVALTPGKERIWKGWDKSIPDFSSGEISGFLGLQKDALTGCFESLPRVRNQGRSSAALGIRGFLEYFRTELSRIDNQHRGAACACTELISRVSAFLIDISEPDEEDPSPANIQTVRRRFDEEFAETVHFPNRVDIHEARQRLVNARSHLSRMLRLKIISAPPAVSGERWNGIHWKTEGSAGLAQSISNAEKRVLEAWKECLQSLAEKEEKMQGAIDEVTSERKRRDEAIKAAEHDLQRSAEECRRLARKLRQIPAWSRFLASAEWTPCGARLRGLHERLGELRRHILPTNALRAADAYSDRAELEVERIFYRVRDDSVQLVLNRVRSSHDDLSATVKALQEISTINSRAGLRIDPCPFSRALISDDNLDAILDDFERNCESEANQQYPSFLELVSRSREELEGALLERSRALFQAFEPRPISDYIRAAQCDLKAALIWMKHVSRPWFPYEAPHPDESVLVLADENTWRDGALRGAFAGARWIGNRTSDWAAVLRVQPIGTFDQVRLHLNQRGFLPVAKAAAAHGAE